MGGGNGGIRRWRLADGQEVPIRNQTEMELRAICMSKNQKWIVCGTTQGASVWDGEMNEKFIDVQGESRVWAVDISPDSTRFATGTYKNASIWSFASGKRLVGPLDHLDNEVAGLRFSPTGERVATACWGGHSICIFDSHTGDKLITIKVDTASWLGTLLAWSNDAQRIFATSEDKKIRAFDVSTGSQLAQSQVLHDDNKGIPSIALAPNSTFIASFASHSISFLDASTLAHIDLAIKDSKETRSISISPNNSYVATGRYDGKIVIRDLSKLLPDSYGPFHVSIRALVVLRCGIVPFNHSC